MFKGHITSFYSCEYVLHSLTNKELIDNKVFKFKLIKGTKSSIGPCHGTVFTKPICSNLSIKERLKRNRSFLKRNFESILML